MSPCVPALIARGKALAGWRAFLVGHVLGVGLWGGPRHCDQRPWWILFEMWMGSFSSGSIMLGEVPGATPCQGSSLKGSCLQKKITQISHTHRHTNLFVKLYLSVYSVVYSVKFHLTCKKMKKKKWKYQHNILKVLFFNARFSFYFTVFFFFLFLFSDCLYIHKQNCDWKCGDNWAANMVCEKC